MNKLRGPTFNFGLALLSAILLIAATPNWNQFWLAPFALVPLLYALAREPRPLFRFLLGYAAGIVYWGSVCFWIQFVLEYHGGMGRWGGWGAFILFCLYKGLHLGVFGLLAGVLLQLRWAAPAVAALWVGIERTHGTFAFAWLTLGNAGIDMAIPLRLAPVLGVYGISFLFALIAAGGALILLRRPRKDLAPVAAILSVFLFPALRVETPADQTAVLLQPNLPEEGSWTAESTAAMHSRLIKRTFQQLKSGPAQIAVWPEAPGPLYYYADAEFRNKVISLARNSQTPFLFGTVGQTPKGAPLNSAVLLRSDGSLVDRYDKINLVPFGEFVPPLFSFVNRITQEAGDFVPGERTVVFPINGRHVGAFICYESAFPNDVRQFVRNGAELLVNISNDGYFGHSAAREQHLSLVRMRAVENHRWVLRATNDGISAAVNPIGRIGARLPLYTEFAARVPYAYEQALTPYSQWGDWFAWGCLLASGAALLLSQRPNYQPRVASK